MFVILYIETVISYLITCIKYIIIIWSWQTKRNHTCTSGEHLAVDKKNND